MVGQHEVHDPMVIAQAVGSVAWAISAAVCVGVVLRNRVLRASVWPVVLVPHCGLAGWWAWRNILRWLTVVSTAEHRDTITPLVPALFVSLTLLLVVVAGRLRKYGRIAIVIETTDRDGDDTQRVR